MATQNFASEANFPLVFRRTRASRPRLCRRWLRALEERRPDLAPRATRGPGSGSGRGRAGRTGGPAGHDQDGRGGRFAVLGGGQQWYGPGLRPRAERQALLDCRGCQMGGG